MLRTGQSLIANAPVYPCLGRLSTDVGQWFGPSVAAGGIRSVNIFSLTHSLLILSQVFAASHGIAVLPTTGLLGGIICGVLGVTEPCSFYLGLGWASSALIRFIMTLSRSV